MSHGAIAIVIIALVLLWATILCTIKVALEHSDEMDRIHREREKEGGVTR